MTRRQLALLLATAAVWGSSFMFIKIALRDLDPVTLIAARASISAIALLALVPFAFGTARARDLTRRRWRRLLVAGFLNMALPWLLIVWGQQWVDSGFAAILNASAPLWAALLAFLFIRSEAVSGLRLAGFVLGFGGVVVLVGTSPGGGTKALLGSLAIVAAAGSQALGTFYVARRVADVPPMFISTAMITVAAILTLPAGIVTAPGQSITWEAVAAVAALGLFATALASVMFMTLLSRAGPSSAILVTYLVPPAALLYGVVLLGEPLTASAVVGLALIIGGVALGTGTIGRRRRLRAAEVDPAGPALARSEG